MTKSQLGKFELASVHDIWKHEEREFTPWLAENIDDLSALLGVSIVVDQTEHRVGNYELDILGHVDETDAVVIIENQLNGTDHKHLGQLIAYAAGLDAAIIVWVSPEIRDEHRAAVEWLNSNTGERVSFFLVRPEVFRIDDSNPAIRFHIEVGPSEFGRQLRNVVEKEDTARHALRLTFWEGLLKYLVDKGHDWAKGRNATRNSWIGTPVGKSGIGANVSMAHGSRLRVEIYCVSDPDKKLFERLFAHKQEIQTKLGNESVSWERLDDADASRIAVYRPWDKARAADDSSYRRELFEWIERNLTILRGVAKQYLA